MKRLITFLILIYALQSRAAFITATVSVTNAPVNGSTIANGADIRLWTNTVAAGATQIAIAGSNILNASNLFYQTAQFRFNNINVSWDGVSSNVVFFGQSPLQLTLSTAWAKIVYITNSGLPYLSVSVINNPNAAGITQETSSNQTVISSGIVAAINSKATNVFPSNSPVMVQFPSLANNQTFTGTNIFTNTVVATSTNDLYTGSLSGCFVASLPPASPNLLFVADSGPNFFAGENIIATNANASSVVFYSSADYTLPLNQWTLYTNGNSGTGAPIVGGYRWSAVATNTVPTYFVAFALDANTPVLSFPLLLETPVGGGAYTPSYPMPIYQASTFCGSIGKGSGGDWEAHDAQNINRWQMTKQSLVMVFNYSAVNLGGQKCLIITTNYFAFVDTNDNYLMISTNLAMNFLGGVIISSNLIQSSASQSNLLSGTNNFTGPTSITNTANIFSGTVSNIGVVGPVILSTVSTNGLNGTIYSTRFNNGALANGMNQDVNLGTNVFTKFTSPTAAYSTAGFIGAIDDRIVVVHNATMNAWTINNNSGFESTPANRIYTGTGADVVLSSNSFAMFKYDSSATHWLLIFASGTPSSGGSGAFSGSFTGNGAGITNISSASVSGIPVVNQGTTNVSTATSFIATFATPFADTNYTALSIGNGLALASQSVTLKTTTNVTFNMGIATGAIDWIAIHK